MARFCPYCGKQLSERSRFCPKCGKAAPERRDAVAVEDPTDGITDKTGIGPAATAARSAVADGPAGGRARPTVGSPRVRSNGRTRTLVRRYAPPTHALVGPHEQAGFGLRYGAWMFDFLITLIAMMVFTFAVTAYFRRSVIGSNYDLLIVAGLTILIVVLNFVVFAGATGQSLGMKILGIHIVRVDGEQFSRKDAVIRHLVGYPLSMMVFFLGFMWMLWDPRQQGWHDKLARTIVVMR